MNREKRDHPSASCVNMMRWLGWAMAVPIICRHQPSWEQPVLSKSV